MPCRQQISGHGATHQVMAASSPSAIGLSHSSTIPLRILPLGDSTTRGGGDDRFNAYRPALRNMLIGSGRSIDYIGSLTHGDSLDNEHEGHAGSSIKDIRSAIAEDNILLQHPNVILLHAGTNDMNTYFGQPPTDPFEEAPGRLSTLVEAVLCECPDAVLLVAKIIDNTQFPQLVSTFNSGVEMIVAHWRAQGYKVRVADHSAIRGTDLSGDGLHPVNVGYEKMARVWFDTIQDLPPNWISAPRDASLVSSPECRAKLLA
ncbi:carbohydrate esterase family 3 protein [Cercospora zeae-maydis SCOH1-5]|uniref:Carbohydrate esterase family 3 protein n=1 Tax=Cercospora zeae-maydis SCOH1-5 TaxID=717836 RepID=A0A6A6FGY5_9PEZI|nr:carbohydrate esterase family 3 protein [Cercospora zeae-maydis SCOH1-5]